MTRTCDLRFRKPSLYPAELRDREPGEKHRYRVSTRALLESLPRTTGRKLSLTASDTHSAEAFQPYFPTTFTFQDGLKAELIAHDGRALRNTAVTPSPPVAALTNVLSFGAAERYDLRLRPPAGAQVGSTFGIRVDFRHWITGEVVGTRNARVRVI